VCVHDREGVSQEGTKNLHRYKECERDMYEIVEARACGCINLYGGWSINVCERNMSRGCESESFVCVREIR
jgi:hypothetical protein